MYDSLLQAVFAFPGSRVIESAPKVANCNLPFGGTPVLHCARLYALRPGGAALGLVSTRAAGVAVRVVAVEANADLLPVARRTHDVHGVTADLLHAVVGPKNGEADLWADEEFWASSTAKGAGVLNGASR